MIDVSQREFQRAFQTLRADFESCHIRGSRASPGPLLLGLYGLECGLKLLLLKTRAVHSTRQLERDDLFFTHDLNQLLRQVNHPPRFTPNNTAEAPRNLQVSPRQLHELYRYGGRLKKTDETALCTVLTELFLFIDENLS